VASDVTDATNHNRKAAAADRLSQDSQERTGSALTACEDKPDSASRQKLQQVQGLRGWARRVSNLRPLACEARIASRPNRLWVAVVRGSRDSRLMTDVGRSTRMSVDTGSETSLLPDRRRDRRCPQRPPAGCCFKACDRSSAAICAREGRRVDPHAINAPWIVGSRGGISNDGCRSARWGRTAWTVAPVTSIGCNLDYACPPASSPRSASTGSRQPPPSSGLLLDLADV
jgi:hypothetical protein